MMKKMTHPLILESWPSWNNIVLPKSDSVFVFFWGWFPNLQSHHWIFPVMSPPGGTDDMTHCLEWAGHAGHPEKNPAKAPTFQRPNKFSMFHHVRRWVDPINNSELLADCELLADAFFIHGDPWGSMRVDLQTWNRHGNYTTTAWPLWRCFACFDNLCVREVCIGLWMYCTWFNMS